jgi:hypothetical protein
LFFVSVSAKQFIIPNDKNVRGKIVLGTNPTISHTIGHGLLNTASYSIGINYYKSGCQGVPVASANPLTAPLDYSVDTASIGGDQYQSTVVNGLATLRNAGNDFFTVSGTPAVGKYAYCIEFVLLNSLGTVIDQERYNVAFDATTDGTVSTNTNVITEILTALDPTKYTAKVTVCDPVSGSLVTKNYFRGDFITFCFNSNEYPAASISDLTLLQAKYSTSSSTSVTISIKNGETTGTNVGLGTFVGGSSCFVTAGVQTCRYTVQLGTIGATGPTAPLNDLFASSTPGEPRSITVEGTLAMRFGTGRRNVRVLVADFDRTTKSEFTVASVEEKGTCQCSGLFFIICWFFRCLLGFLF